MEKITSKKDEKEEIQTLNLSKLEDKLKLNFDYEINTVKPDENNDLSYILSFSKHKLYILTLSL